MAEGWSDSPAGAMKMMRETIARLEDDNAKLRARLKELEPQPELGVVVQPMKSKAKMAPRPDPRVEIRYHVGLDVSVEQNGRTLKTGTMGFPLRARMLDADGYAFEDDDFDYGAYVRIHVRVLGKRALRETGHVVNTRIREDEVVFRVEEHGAVTMARVTPPQDRNGPLGRRRRRGARS